MSGHCSHCGAPIEGDPSPPDEFDTSEEGWASEGPVEGGGGRVYCTMACAAVKQGWAYE